MSDNNTPRPLTREDFERAIESFDAVRLGIETPEHVTASLAMLRPPNMTDQEFVDWMHRSIPND